MSNTNKLKTSCNCIRLTKTSFTEMGSLNQAKAFLLRCVMYMKYTIIEGHHDRSREHCREISLALLLFDFKRTTGTLMAEHRHADRTNSPPFNVPATILIAGTQSVNSPARISTIKMWSGMPLKRWVQNKRKQRQKRNKFKETSIAATATTTQSVLHAQPHCHADTGTIKHTHSRVKILAKLAPRRSRRLKNLAGLNRKSTQHHYSILDNKLGWQGVHTHTHTLLSSPHTNHVPLFLLFFHRYTYIYIYTSRNHS